MYALAICGCNRMGTQLGPGGIARAVPPTIATFAATALYPAAALPGGGIAVLLVARALVLAAPFYTAPAAVGGRTA